MKKQTIKLNESQLRKMIKEALNELDWTITSTLDNFNTNENSNLGFELYSQDEAPRGAFNPGYCYAHGWLEDDLGTDLICFDPSAKKEISPDGTHVKEGTYKCNYQGKPCTLYAGISVNMPHFPTGLVCYDDDKEGIEYIKNEYNLGNLNESKLRKMIKESLNEFIGGIRPGARYGNKNFNVKTLINEVEIALNEIDRQCDHLIKLSSQLPGDVFNNNFDSELNRYAGNIGALNQELTDKFWESIKGVQINESQLSKIIKEGIKKVLKENDFAPHGYMTTSNLGGKEIEISNSNDAVRFRTEDGSISDWFEIEYDEEGNPIVNTPWGTEDLNNYMRFN